MIKTVVVEMSGDKDKFTDRLKGVQKFAQNFPDFGISMFVPEEYKLNSFILAKNIKPIQSVTLKQSLRFFAKEENSVFVSAGNTGDIALYAHAIIGTIGGKLTPTILANTFPKVDGHTVFLDMGASLWPTEQLIVWAALAGKSMAEILYKKAKIGLINIGEEKDKGGELKKIRLALEKELPNSKIENIEMNNLAQSDINVAVTSGFLGNLTIKTFEGTFKTLYKKSLKGPFAFLTRILFMILYKLCWQDLNWKKYSGAYLLGVKKPILITHGCSDEESFYQALVRAIDPLTEKIYEKINNDPAIKNWIEKCQKQTP